MKSVGIIAEFNPFHNGHQYFLQEAKRRSSADCVIVVMSGSFVQRGDVAILDKWTRTGHALRFGADLVLELPVVYALQSAEVFACGGISLLSALGADAVAFGTESANAIDLKRITSELTHPSEAFQTEFSSRMEQGYGYAASEAFAIKTVFGASFPMTPNHILALEYMMAAKRMDYAPDWVVVKRKGAAHDSIGTGTVTSGSHLRSILFEHPSDARPYLPYEPSPPSVQPSIIQSIALANLRRISIQELRTVSGVSEGLEHRIKRCAMEGDFDSFVKSAVTKRYTAARIRRTAYNALLGIDESITHTPPAYIRVLGMTEKGAAFLKKKKAELSLPVITKTADAPPCAMLEKDILATDLRALATDHSRGGEDYLRSPVICMEEE